MLWVVTELIWGFASWHEQQQIGRVRYFQVVRFVFTAQNRVLVFVTSDYETDEKNEKIMSPSTAVTIT